MTIIMFFFLLKISSDRFFSHTKEYLCVYYTVNVFQYLPVEEITSNFLQAYLLKIFSGNAGVKFSTEH